MNPTNKPKLSALAAMFVTFPRQEREGTEKQLLEVYLLALEDIPSDFVAMACKRFIQGQVERQNYTFRPPPPELAVECRRLRERAIKATAQPLKLPDGSQLVPERRIEKPFMPYPKLWDALEGEPDLLKALNALTFDGMTALSKLFATEGIDVVRDKLRPMPSAPDRESQLPVQPGDGEGWAEFEEERR